MKRIFSPFAYGPDPRNGCWWDETCDAPHWPRLDGTHKTDVAVVGGGFTGISAALHLAEAGVSVTVLEAQTPGWGASGRNGGFCCMGGGRIEPATLAKRHGESAARDWVQCELDAVDLVQSLLTQHKIDADCHSKGETLLAHHPKRMKDLRQAAESETRFPGLSVTLTERADLADQGLNGPFYGALTLSKGFALNPRKYLFGLAGAASRAGAQLFERSEVQAVERDSAGYRLKTASGDIHADQVIFATNGYSSESLPGWLGGRYLPTQSNVLVTRPLSDNELAAQGWTSDQMAYDTRGLLHYFRLMPDRRFLFGMRGGMNSSPRAEARARQNTRRDFERMFPAWSHVESPHMWSGMVCIAQRGMPFVGQVPDHPGLWLGMCYHGNGVAMGSYCGALLAKHCLGTPDGPEVLNKPLRRFPLGRARRLLMPPAYVALMLRDL